MTTKKAPTTKALAVVPPEPPAPVRRVVGRAVETNPLIGAIACVTPDTLKDVEEEIAVTENYLAGLRAMYHIGSLALGLPVAEVEPAAEVEQVSSEPKPTPKPKPPRSKTATGKPRGRPGLSTKIREWLQTEPNITNEEIVNRVKAMGNTKDEQAVRAIIYNARSVVKKDFGDAAPAVPKAQPTGNDGALRKQIAEHVFKKGLLSAEEIAEEFKIGVDRVATLITNHPWFEAFSKKWRLTYAGRTKLLIIEPT